MSSRTTAPVRIAIGVAMLLVARAALAQPAWVPTDLGTLGGARSEAHAINAEGWVVGSGDTLVGHGPTHAFLWQGVPGGMFDLGTLGGSTSSASGINSARQIVGQIRR